MAFVKTLILWAEMIGWCLGEGAAPSLVLNMQASTPAMGQPRHVVMSAKVEIDVDDAAVDCLSEGLAELGW